MKKIMILIVMFAIGNSLYAQRTEPGQPITKAEYLTKSKNQKTSAWLLLGGGALMTAAGLISFANTFEVLNSGNDSEETLSIVLAGVGVAAMAGSIPLFVASARNKNKANNLAVDIQLQSRGVVKGRILEKQRYPALSLKLALK